MRRYEPELQPHHVAADAIAVIVYLQTHLRELGRASFRFETAELLTERVDELAPLT
jgi:hypothetical protein